MPRFLPVLFFAAMLLAGCDKPVSSPEPKPATSAAPVAETPKSPSQEGQWQATSAVLAGTAFPDEVTATIKMKLTGDLYEVAVGETMDKGTCTVDDSQSPMQMTIVGTVGPNNGKTFLAVFDFPNDNEMRVCYDLTGNTFPKVFASTAENGLYLATYSRNSGQK